jgi:hypothetical protein
LRIASLSALAIYVDPGFLHGRLHQYGGMFFFASAFVPLALVFVCLQKKRGSKSGVTKPEREAISAAKFSRKGVKL